MENAGIQKQQTAGTSSTARPMWDPFWFMRAMLSWARPADAPSFDVKETDDTYVCKVKLALPEQADAAHVKAELKDGELTLRVPKAAAAAPEPESESDPQPEQDSMSASPKARRPRGNGRRGSAKRRPRRRART